MAARKNTQGPILGSISLTRQFERGPEAGVLGETKFFVERKRLLAQFTVKDSVKESKIRMVLQVKTCEGVKS